MLSRLRQWKEQVGWVPLALALAVVLVLLAGAGHVGREQLFLSHIAGRAALAAAQGNGTHNSGGSSGVDALGGGTPDGAASHHSEAAAELAGRGSAQAIAQGASAASPEAPRLSTEGSLQGQPSDPQPGGAVNSPHTSSTEGEVPPTSSEVPAGAVVGHGTGLIATGDAEVVWPEAGGGDAPEGAAAAGAAAQATGKGHDGAGPEAVQGSFAPRLGQGNATAAPEQSGAEAGQEDGTPAPAEEVVAAVAAEQHSTAAPSSGDITATAAQLRGTAAAAGQNSTALPAEQGGVAAIEQQTSAAATTESGSSAAAPESNGTAATTATERQEAEQGHSTAASSTGLACEASGYCSVGKVKHFRGDVATNEGLRRMLAAVAYRQEVFLVTTGATGSLPLAINMLKSAEELGLAHGFLLTSDEQLCNALPTPYQHNVSCVWDSRPSAIPPSAPQQMWTRRWEVTARMVRMGYNVLSVDTDVVFLDDPYKYFKSKDLGHFNALMMRDGDDYGGATNCGVIYLQNAHPSGPTAWMAVEQPDRTLRQWEGVEAMQAAYPQFGYEHVYEQFIWDDVINSAAAGRPVIITTTRPISTPQWVAENEAYVYRGLTTVDYEWPEDWYLRVGSRTTPFSYILNLTIPRPPSDDWWHQNRKFFYPPTRGEASNAFYQLVLNASEAPFPDMDKPWQPPAGGLPPENFAFMPSFLSATYIARAQPGFWALQPPAEVIAHTVYLPGPEGSGLWKAYAFRGFGWWRYEVTEAFSNATVLGLRDPKLLMLAPGVELHTETEQQFSQAVAQLAHLAEAMGRRAVVPPVPCDSRWLGIWENSVWQSRTSLPLFKNFYDGFQVLQFPDPQRPNQTYCLWMRSLTHSCVAATPPHTDALAFLARLDPPSLAAPAPGNTLFHDAWVGRQGGSGSNDGEGGSNSSLAAQPLLPVGVSSVVADAAALGDNVPVLFLGALPAFVLAEGGASGGGNGGELPPLPPVMQECYLYRQEAPGFFANPEGQANRAAWLQERGRAG